MSLAYMALCFGVITTEVLWIIVKHRDTRIVKANNRALSYVLFISLILCFFCSLLFIGCPNTATCILQQITFRAVFTAAVAKTLTVILVFKARTPGRTMRRLLVTGASNYIIPMCSLIRVISVEPGWEPLLRSLRWTLILTLKSSLSCAKRAQSLPSTVSWDTRAP